MLNDKDKDSLEVSTENDVNWIPILCVNGHHSIVYSIRKLGGFDEKLNSPGYLCLKGVIITWEIVQCDTEFYFLLMELDDIITRVTSSQGTQSSHLALGSLALKQIVKSIQWAGQLF